MIKKWWLTVLTSLALSLGAWGGGPTTHAVELETSTPTSLTDTKTPAVNSAAPAVNAAPTSLTASNPTVVLPVMAAPPAPVAPPRSRTSLLISPAPPPQLVTDTPAANQPTPGAAVQSVKSAAALAPSPAKPSPPPAVLSPISPAASSTAGTTLAPPLTNQRNIAPASPQPLLARGHHSLKPNLAKPPVSAPALTRQLPLNSTPAAPPYDQPLWQWGVIGSLVILIGLLGGQIARCRYPKAPPSE
ncbi:hypothetical protein [Limosilactobacillus ingluviei]|uniref:hypothetical protein n=1 Tax=Limosilactobacillus ingluviei TaxID=148604 RepID=UPI0024BAB3BB|nr:hypothetical protein [Limosilactobacillus ingluviei]